MLYLGEETCFLVGPTMSDNHNKPDTHVFRTGKGDW